MVILVKLKNNGMIFFLFYRNNGFDHSLVCFSFCTALESNILIPVWLEISCSGAIFVFPPQLFLIPLKLV